MLITDRFERLSVVDADRLARELTTDRIRVGMIGANATLWCEQERTTVHLLPYQLCDDGIRNVIAENDPWPKG